MISQDKIVKKLESMRFWREVYYRPLAKDVVIRSTSYDETKQQCTINIQYSKNGSPISKNITFHESVLMDRIESDFEYKDGPVTIKTELVKPEIAASLPKAEVVSQPKVPQVPQVPLSDDSYFDSIEMDGGVKTGMDMLRDSLSGAISGIEKGVVEPDAAKAIAAVAQVILNSVKLEMEYRFKTGGKVKMLEANGN